MCRLASRRMAPVWLVCVLAVVAVVGLVAAPAAAGTSESPPAPQPLRIWRGGSIGLDLEWPGGGQFDAGVTMDSLCLMIGARIRGVELVGGVASLKWGPGRNGSLALSGVADPMPIAGYRLEEEKADYIRFAGLMERDPNRTLVAHRLNYRPAPWLRLGISETAVLSGDPSTIFYFPFPGTPVYALQHVASQEDPRRGNDANVNIGADFALEFGGVELYGEFLIDDAQGSLSRRDSVPDFVGILGGLEVRREVGGDAAGGAGAWLLAGNVEYIRINNYVYSHRVPNNCYVYHDVGLGHPLGPDADAMVLTVRAEAPAAPAAPAATRIELKASRERHGEGHIGLPWRAEFGKDEIFLSGIVERVWKLELAVERRIAGGMWLTANAGMARSENHRNVAGADFNGLSAGLGLRLELDTGINMR